MATESPPPAPAVVAVVVACDPGTWFPEALASLAAQDYPNLSVLVLDAGSEEDLTQAVAEVMPGAFVRRLGRRSGFAAAANEVLQIVEGASHYLFCHDDVALAPDAVRMLVEEAYRSNAGVAAPKYVQWHAPGHLLAVGATTDKVGARRSLVDPGELDQEQHDAVREVLVAPGGALLVRADLFSALGGFDEAVASDGEDTDLSWRARLYGARVMVVPAARVRHLEASLAGLRPGSPDVRRRERNRYRLLLTCYRWYTLVWLLPLAAFWAVAEAVVLTVRGRGAEASVVLGSLGGALRQPGLRRSRRQVQRQRQVGDRALRELQVRGNARLRDFVQSRVEGVRAGLEHQGLTARVGPVGVGGPDPDSDGRAVAPPEPEGPLRRGRHSLNGALVTLLLVVFIIGTRSLFGKGLPQIATLPATSEGLGSIWRSWWSAWQPGGLGVAAPSSPALALIGILGSVLFGAVGTLEHVLVLGPLVIGPLGAYRASRFWGSPRAQVVAAVAYAVVPLPYNDLAGGHWDGLIAYAATPWVLAMLCRLSALVPVAASPVGRIWARVLGLGMLTAVTASVAPSYLYVVPLMGLALLVGSALSTGSVPGIRAFGVSVAAAVAAFVFLLPWSSTVVVSHAALVGVDPGPAGRLGLGQILRFDTGPFGTGAWEWLLLLAAALPLFVGRDWRLAWAARFWSVSLLFFALSWMGLRGWLPPLPAGVLLAPAAAGLAGSAALGVAAFELDLPGYNFGWRQGAAALAGACLALAAIPWFAAAGSGRWDLPSADASSVLLLPNTQNGDFRVLWVGAPAALPLAGRQLEQGVGYGTSYDGVPSLADSWTTGAAGAAPVLAKDLVLVQGQLTTKLGHLLAPAGIRYIVVPNHVGPSGAGGRPVPVPNSLLAGLSLQTDLVVQPSDQNYTVYENAAWAPIRSVLPAQAAQAASAGGVEGERQLQHTDLEGATPVLRGGSVTSASGPVPSGATVSVGATRAAGWRLTVAGHSVGAQPSFGWAMAFKVPDEATATVTADLHYSAPTGLRAGYIVEIVLWAAAIVAMAWERRRRTGDEGYTEMPDRSWFVPLAAPPARKRRAPAGRRPDRPGPVGPDPDPESDEVWTDA